MKNLIQGNFNKTLFSRVFLWFLAILLVYIVSSGEVFSEGDVFQKGDAKIVMCTLPTHREQTPDQAAADEPGDVFDPSEFSGYNAYLTADMNSPGNPAWLDDPECNYSIGLSDLAVGQHYIYFETVDTAARVSKQSEIYPFEVKDGPIVPKIIMPPNPPALVVVGPGGPIAVFGPVTTPTEFESTPDIKAAKFIVINATLNSLGASQGLFSRDESGQTAPGHTTISVLENGIVTARNQGPEGTESLSISTTTPVEPSIPFTLALNIGPGGLRLYHNGISVGHDERYHLLSGNDLPLVVGGMCSGCTPLDRTPSRPIDGEVSVEMYSTEMVLLGGGGVS